MKCRQARALPGFLLLLLACSRTPEDSREPAAHVVEGEVTLTPEQEGAAEIETVTVTTQAMTESISATAILEAPPDQTARLGSRVVGRVTRVEANVGDTLAAGEMVIHLDAPELGRAKADYLAALKWAEVARQVAERERSLFQERISSERDWQRAEADAVRAEADRDAAENVLHALGMEDEDLDALKAERHYTSTLAVRTPISGTVVERSATPGQVVQPSDVLLVVMDVRRLWVLIDVYDTQLARIRAGQQVWVRTRAWPDRVFEGRVDQIGATVEAASRAVKVRVALANPEGRLRPGMFADVEVEVGSVGAAQLAVPAAAVQQDGGETIVFVALGEGRFARRVVVTGTVTPRWVAIREGLAEGERVVTTGGFVLKSELRKSELGEEGN